MAEYLCDILFDIKFGNKDKQLQVLKDWEKRNDILKEVIQGKTTFTKEAEIVREKSWNSLGHDWFVAKTNREKQVEECLGEYKSLDLAYDVLQGAGWSGAVGVGIGLLSGKSIAKKEPHQMSQREREIYYNISARSEAPMTRREFAGASAVGTAMAATIMGGIGGLLMNMWDRSTYSSKGEFLDRKVSEFYKK